MTANQSFWVYILLCQNNSYYTGYTSDLEKRFIAHCEGRARCKYTRSFKPIKIAQSWQICTGKADAMAIERAIKKLTRSEKEQIITTPELLFNKTIIR